MPLFLIILAKTSYALRQLVPDGPSSSTTPIDVNASRAASAAAQSFATRASLRCLMSASILSASSSSPPPCNQLSGEDCKIPKIAPGLLIQRLTWLPQPHRIFVYLDLEPIQIAQRMLLAHLNHRPWPLQILPNSHRKLNR